VPVPGAVRSSQVLNAVAFDGGFEVYVEVMITSSHGSVRGAVSASWFRVSTSLV
jgi:hypothetical protein